MIVINSHVFAIEPKDQGNTAILSLFDPHYVEVYTRDILDGQASVYAFSLDTAQWAYRGIAVWVCPD